MTRFYLFLTGTFFGLLTVTLLFALAIVFLPHLVTVANEPSSADAIVILGGGKDGGRLRKGLKLHDEKFAPYLILIADSKKTWESVLKKHCPDCLLEGKDAVYLYDSIDTRTDAQISLKYSLDNSLQTLVVVTSPYHSRRAQFVFNDIFDGSGVSATVVSSEDYGKFLTPDDAWWRDRKTLEKVWLEFGKILYWELTPFLEFQG